LICDALDEELRSISLVEHVLSFDDNRVKLGKHRGCEERGSREAGRHADSSHAVYEEMPLPGYRVKRIGLTAYRNVRRLRDTDGRTSAAKDASTKPTKRGLSNSRERVSRRVGIGKIPPMKAEKKKLPSTEVVGCGEDTFRGSKIV
jgi:hypothetical protein